MDKLCDRGWIENFNEKCASSIKDFSVSVCRLQDALIREQQNSSVLADRCKALRQEVTRLEQQLRAQNKQTSSKTIGTSTVASSVLNKSTSSNDVALELEQEWQRMKEKKQRGRSSSSTFTDDTPPAQLNNAMHSEQLQMDTSGILSPGQRARVDCIPETECPQSPQRWLSVVKENTSPTLKLRPNENHGALEFVRASGRVGQLLQRMPQPHLLREHNCGDSFVRPKLSPARKSSKKRTEWLSKDVSDTAGRGKLKRSATTHCAGDANDYQWKRNLLSLSRSSERKLKQARLTQMRVMRQESRKPEVDISTFCEHAANFEHWSHATDAEEKQQQRADQPLQHQSSNTVDIFQHTDESNDESNAEDDLAFDETPPRSRRVSEVFPFQTEHLSDNDTSSVLVVTPPPPPIIDLDDSNDEAETAKNCDSTAQRHAKSKIKMEANTEQAQRLELQQQQTQKSCQAPLNKQVKMLCDEWSQDGDDTPDTCMTSHDVRKDKPTQWGARISIKEMYNIDCEDCQNYIDFMHACIGNDEIEELLRKCTRHKQTNANIPTTPTNFWNPLMTTFSQDDPRNQTLLEDPVKRRKRGGK